MHRYLLRKLQAAAALSPADSHALLDAVEKVVEFKPRETIQVQGDQPAHSATMLDGWAVRHQHIRDGRRQVLSYLLPGDWPDLNSYFLPTLDHSITAITNCRLAFISHGEMKRLLRARPELAEVLWRDTMVESAIFREWVVNLGARPALVRMAHVMCELHAKLNHVGMADGDDFPFPLTQEDMADTIGVTGVHVNRVLKDLRERGLISQRRGRLVIHDLEGLQTLGDFDPQYLHLEVAPTDGVERARASA